MHVFGTTQKGAVALATCRPGGLMPAAILLGPRSTGGSGALRAETLGAAGRADAGDDNYCCGDSSAMGATLTYVKFNGDYYRMSQYTVN